MAAALARQFWPKSLLCSAGTQVRAGDRAAREAVTEMAMRKHDISQHRATSVDNLELHAFDWIVAMDPEVRRRLIDFYAAPELKIKARITPMNH